MGGWWWWRGGYAIEADSGVCGAVGGNMWEVSWTKSLLLGQNMDGQRWRSAKENHVDTEPTELASAVNVSISLGSLFKPLFNWEGMQGLLDQDVYFMYLSLRMLL